MLGGGAFGNRQEWILDAIEYSLGPVPETLFSDGALQIRHLF
jgi:hypothetical protein